MLNTEYFMFLDVSSPNQKNKLYCIMYIYIYILDYTVPLRTCLDLKTPVGRTIVFPWDSADITIITQ